MHDFRLHGLSAVQVQPDAGLYLMKPLPPCRAGVQKQHIPQRSHTFNAKDMTVAANEHVRWILAQHRAETGLPSIRMSCDVCHPESKAFELESVVRRVATQDVLPVYVARYRARRSDLGKTFKNRRIADVARMQDEVAISERGG